MTNLRAALQAEWKSAAFKKIRPNIRIRKGYGGKPAESVLRIDETELSAVCSLPISAYSRRIEEGAIRRARRFYI